MNELNKLMKLYCIVDVVVLTLSLSRCAMYSGGVLLSVRAFVDMTHTKKYKMRYNILFRLITVVAAAPIMQNDTRIKLLAGEVTNCVTRVVESRAKK